MPANKTYRIVYDVHCTLQNFFGKEILIKNCWGELHAKIKLEGFAKKKYGVEFSYIVVKTCSEQNSNDPNALINDIFGNNKTMTDIFGDAFKNRKK